MTENLQWEVVAEPVGKNAELKPGKGKGRKRLTGAKDDADKDNVGGIVVYVALGARREEVSRVGFIRAASENPDVSFKDKLDEIIGVAEKTRDELNKLTQNGDLQ